MGIAVTINVFIYGGLILIAVLSWFLWDKRYHRNQGADLPQGYIATDEVFMDPVTGKKLKVYYDSRTGNRFYHEG